jgi:cytochrome c-type biogenesis protein CcmF
VQYPNTVQAVGSPGIGAGLKDDLYTILAAYDQRTLSWATIRMRVIPLVSWLWLGGAVVGIGALIAALPAPRRRVVRMPVAEAPAPAK